MADNPIGELIDLRQFHQERLYREASRLRRSRSVSFEEAEAAAARAAAFERETIQINKRAGLYDYKERARFYKVDE